MPLAPDYCPAFGLVEEQDERERKVRDIEPRVVAETDPRVRPGLERKELVSQEKTKGQSDSTSHQIKEQGQQK